jgi:hypothetical protein
MKMVGITRRSKICQRKIMAKRVEISENLKRY